MPRFRRFESDTMSDVTPTPPGPPHHAASNGDTSRFITTFVAGVLVGVFAAVGVVPGGGGGTPSIASAPMGSGEMGGTDGGTDLGDGTDLGGGDLGDSGGGDLGGGAIVGDDGGLGGSDLGGGMSGDGGGGTTVAPSGVSGDSGDASAGGGTTTAGGSSGGGVSIGGGTSGTGSSGGTGSSTGTGTTGSSGGSGGGTGGSGGDACAANNGGATDKGVTAKEIRVAATKVDDGPGASLLKQATVAMQAVINQVNSQGGICGRRIVLETKNDSWDAARGRDFIRRFIEQDNFALLVVPSSEGLAAAIEAGDISRAKIPVVGTTGLRIDEYSDPWVFPVATPTVSIMRIMAAHAHRQGAKTFGIVWDSKYRFGLEGATAFKDYVKGLPGAQIKADTPLDPTKAGNYATEAQQFNTACGNSDSGSGCDMVALLLVPQTAERWKEANGNTNQGRGAKTHAAQTLFTDDFATRCGGWCDGLTVWTGYNPPIAPRNNDGVKTYVRDVQKALPSIDTSNQFVEGAYLGAKVFVDAVTACSPNLTRACIKATLDQANYQTPLASTLVWRPNDHVANKFAQAFGLEASGGSFNGWQYQNTDFVRDPKG